ncbi:hypothetical protein HMPREF1544_08897 [Mucor circinelloides 1006PhL]|uniref:CENP-V/GFA domain-containing protein n=1 Tax=Mucor circinelloides f. circinelloides (strain 1006PhL) TaxID=1220926 RepID=S2JP67_MUCC1|nr:hypothetical protein HMPREF1544_08897 [Mucor circinelloides 1006PhL]
MASNNTQYQGTCICKAIHITLQGEPNRVIACHCVDCQKSSGGPYQISAMYDTQNVKVDDPSKHLKKYVFPKGSADSGFEKHKYFCGVCGTHLFNKPMKHNGEKCVIKTAFLDSANGPGVDLFKPQCEVYTKDRASFVGPIEGIKQFERSI